MVKFLPLAPWPPARGARQSDGIVISARGHHASVSGLIENALDHVEDSVGNARANFEGRERGYVTVAAGSRRPPN